MYEDSYTFLLSRILNVTNNKFMAIAASNNFLIKI